MSCQVAPLKFLTANNSIFGDVPKRLKGPDSKSGRSVLPALGFKSPHLRQKFSGALMCAWNFYLKKEFEPAGLSVKQNSPVNCFVARGGEIGTAAIAWGDEPRNFTEIAKSPHLRQKFSGALMCAWNFYLKKGFEPAGLSVKQKVRCKVNSLYQPAFAEHSGNLSTFSIVVAELILEVKSRWA